MQHERNMVRDEGQIGSVREAIANGQPLAACTWDGGIVAGIAMLSVIIVGALICAVALKGLGI